MINFTKMPSYNLGATTGDGHESHLFLGTVLCKAQRGLCKGMVSPVGPLRQLWPLTFVYC